MSEANYASNSAGSPPMNPLTPAPSGGTKRKRDLQPKFYAVRVGKVPGIYHSWAECLEQVKGFPKAQFKSFTSLTEANQYAEGDAGVSGKGGGVSGGQKWYGVQSGRVPGVYESWQEVLDQITGWKGPKHKVFKTRIEAELFVAEGQRPQYGLQNGYSAEADGPWESIEPADAPAHKKTKASKSKKTNGIKEEATSGEQAGGEYEPGEAPLPEGAEDNFDTSITLDQSTGALRYKNASERTRIKYQATGPVLDAPIRIYTDGSSLANGQASAIGGVGVYFGPQDKRNISEALPGTKQTNQRAELTAIYRALEVAPRDRRIIILSDSNYAIRCANEWFLNWRRNGWVNASKKPVENRDLIQKIVDTLEDRHKMNAHRAWDEDDDPIDGTDPAERGHWERGPAGVKFVWVKGHAKDEGNNAADSLATAAAREARELTRDVILD